MEKIKQIYIILSMTGTRVGKLIQYYTKEPYSHVSLSFDKDLKKMYSFGRKRINNPLIGGFINESMDKGIFFKYKNTECTVYSLDITEEQYSKLKNIIENFEKESDKYKYNFLGVFGAMIGYPFESKYKYFCSQFISHVLMQSGISLFNKPPGLTTPQDFRIYKNKKIIYVGKLIKYASWN